MVHVQSIRHGHLDFLAVWQELPSSGEVEFDDAVQPACLHCPGPSILFLSVEVVTADAVVGLRYLVFLLKKIFQFEEFYYTV